MALPTKDPNDKLDYEVSWAEWLANTDGDTIATSAWIVPDGIVEDETRRAVTATTATIWLSGGTHGQTYLVTNRITTVEGRKVDRTIHIVVRER